MITRMTKTCRKKRCSRQRGFSLAELMVAMVVLLIVIGGVLQLLNQSQQRFVSTTNVEDSTAMAREAVDLMARDIRLAGYPPPKSYPTGVIVAGTNEQYVAGTFVGGALVGGGFLGVGSPATPNLPASPYSIQFEADVGTPANCDGVTLPLTDYRCTSNSGVVSVINYQLQVPTGGATGGCAGLTVNAALTSPTLMRSEVPKNANGAAVTPVYTPYVSDVVNCRVSNPGVPIFTYCPAPPLGTPVASPWPGPPSPCPDMSRVRPTSLAAPRNTRVVLIRLLVQSRTRDPQTGQFQVVDFYNVAERINPDS